METRSHKIWLSQLMNPSSDLTTDDIPDQIPVTQNEDIDMKDPEDLCSSDTKPIDTDTQDVFNVPKDSAVQPPSIEFGSQWAVRKEAHWELAPASKKGVKDENVPGSSPLARSLPDMWSENWYDAQDALPYFSVSQTILTSKIPRALARCVFLTKNLGNINADWRSTTIKFSIQLRYKLELSRPPNWTESAGAFQSKTFNIDYKPPTPIQLKKLIACHDAGVPVRVIAAGDFPSLPVIRQVIQVGEQTLSIGSDNWRNGLVMLGFCWVKKVIEVSHTNQNVDVKTGKCTGLSEWHLEFQYCLPNPPWWCPVATEPEVDEESSFEHSSPIKRVRLSAVSEFDSHDSDMDLDEPTSPTKTTGDKRDHLQCLGDQLYPPMGHFTTQYIPQNSIVFDAQDPIKIEPRQPKPIFVSPERLKMSLAPKEWPDPSSLRPPQIRSSLLLGWHCKNCGKLNPRVKWISTQVCPFCKSSYNLTFPEWHRKAHTEAAGPIGTLYRLDDGGHSHKSGLHQLAARDLTNGMTCVEYWLADPPLPIKAEQGRIKPVRRNGKGGKAPEHTQADSNPIIPSVSHSVSGSVEHKDLSLEASTRPPRDAGGSRAVLSKDTRMLFVHVTCPQHRNMLDLPDAVFSGFASTVPMERQINTTGYKTGASTLSYHYTYLAGHGSHQLHTSSPAVGWEEVPDCVYQAHAMMVDLQSYSIDENCTDQPQFNQSLFVVGSGGNGVNSFKTVHHPEQGPVSYMVLGASCEVEIMVGSGGAKRTTKFGAQRRAEVLVAHGDALFTSLPHEGDPPIEVRVRRTGLSVVVISRYVEIEPPRPLVVTHSNHEVEQYPQPWEAEGGPSRKKPKKPGPSTEPKPVKRKKLS